MSVNSFNTNDNLSAITVQSKQGDTIQTQEFRDCTEFSLSYDIDAFYGAADLITAGTLFKSSIAIETSVNNKKKIRNSTYITEVNGKMTPVTECQQLFLGTYNT